MRRAITTGALGLALTALCGTSLAQPPLPQVNDSYFKAGQTDLARRLAIRPIKGPARNVILFIGDGMGVSTVTAARIYAGQSRGVDGESYNLTGDLLPYSALVKTYSHDTQVADSAPTATALMTGVKTGNGVLGVDQTVPDGDCAAAKKGAVKTLMEMAEDAGMATGVVTTTSVTHATPAATYAHSADRDWESDANLSAKARAEGCADIARQLIEWPHGDGFEVIFGGGRAHLTPKTSADVEFPDRNGRRNDGRDLIAEWRAKTKGAYVWNKQGFDAVDPRTTRHVMGLFNPDMMAWELDRAEDKGGEPSLAEMTAKAIAVLAQGKTGYVLMVEGGRIDHANHANNAARALSDAVAFDDAVKTAVAMTNPKDTLIVVTADHSHGLTISGYPKRGNPILGPVIGVDGKPMLGRDGKGYTTLTYATGPGAAAKDEPRRDPLTEDTFAKDYRQSALIGMGGAAHGGEDVAVRAIGPAAHLLTGTIEQNAIFHVMAHALGKRLEVKRRK